MTAIMQLFMGRNIQQSNTETLTAVSVHAVYELIKEGTDGLADLCKQLHTILRMDKAAYSRNKIRLPFISCASFEGNIRHGKNFRFTESFILDFDGFESEAQIRLEILPSICSNEQVVMAFVSPSGKGLKLLFSLNSPIINLQDYSTFYKNFLYAFAARYQVEKYADAATSDATRVCFLAHDPNVYLNKNASPVNWNSFMPAKPEKIQSAQLGMIPTEGQPDSGGDVERSETGSSKIPNATYEQVVQRLNPKVVTRQSVPIIVPAILEQVAVQVQAAIAGEGWLLKQITNIQYGKKIAAAQGFVWAEVNIFYGKKGFSIVRSPKTGTDATFGAALEALIWKTLQTPCEADYGANPNADDLL